MYLVPELSSVYFCSNFFKHCEIRGVTELAKKFLLSEISSYSSTCHLLKRDFNIINGVFTPDFRLEFSSNPSCDDSYNKAGLDKHKPGSFVLAILSHTFPFLRYGWRDSFFCEKQLLPVASYVGRAKTKRYNGTRPVGSLLPMFAQSIFLRASRDDILTRRSSIRVFVQLRSHNRLTWLL